MINLFNGRGVNKGDSGHNFNPASSSFYYDLTLSVHHYFEYSVFNMFIQSIYRLFWLHFRGILSVIIYYLQCLLVGTKDKRPQGIRWIWLIMWIGQLQNWDKNSRKWTSLHQLLLAFQPCINYMWTMFWTDRRRRLSLQVTISILDFTDKHGGFRSWVRLTVQ